MRGWQTAAAMVVQKPCFHRGKLGEELSKGSPPPASQLEFSICNFQFSIQTALPSSYRRQSLAPRPTPAGEEVAGRLGLTGRVAACFRRQEHSRNDGAEARAATAPAPVPG